jgi:threonine dehydratase
MATYQRSLPVTAVLRHGAAMTIPDVDAAAERIAPYIRKTPLFYADVDGRPAVFKLEHLQLGGSFKLRGALNALLSTTAPDHVVTASGGNYGIGVATAAAKLAIPATIFVPESVPAGKARRIEATGATLIRTGATYAEAAAGAHEFAAAKDIPYLPAYDDPDVIAGQGTLGREIVATEPAVDSIAVAVGGGGLAAGVALSGRTVVAVEPERCCCLHEALRAGHPVDAPVDSIAASALGATRVGALPFEILRSATVRSVLVSDAALLAARDRLWEEFRLRVEPAAAAPFAAFLAGQVPGGLPCIVLCGANTD